MILTVKITQRVNTVDPCQKIFITVSDIFIVLQLRRLICQCICVNYSYESRENVFILPSYARVIMGAQLIFAFIKHPPSV